MSRLRELRLHGFKSFADPTRFIFEPGITAVIGPNGSGKSNMADAIRWVLGEQSNRSLRTRRADDVIFAGSDARKPVGLAEAVLVLDNADHWLPIDYGEVAIARRTYRNGETEYLINGARSRLRDVTDLLAGGALGANQLVVVGQGTVDAALSLRPEERRQLFEEAAGVKSLQVRRNESLARLAKSRDNLSRVADLVGELRPQVRRLAVQATHQQEHQTLVNRAMALADEVYRRREGELRGALAEARRQAAKAEADLATARLQRGDRQEAVTLAEQRYWESDAGARAAGQAWEQARETTIRAEARHEAAAARLVELDSELQRLDAERAQLDASPVSGDSGLTGEGLEQAIAAATAAEVAARQALERHAEAEAGLLAAEQQMAELQAAQDERLGAAAQIQERRLAALARLDRLTAELATIQELRQQAMQAELVARQELATAEVSVADAAREHEARIGAHRSAAQAVSAIQATIDGLAAALRLAEAELAARQTTAASESLAAELGRDGWPPLAALMASVRPEARRAVEAVIGRADEAFGWREGAVGRAPRGSGTVRLLTADDADLDGRERALTAVGATSNLAEFAGIEGGRRLLQITVVAPSREVLLEGWVDLPDGWIAVDPEGDLADSRGVVVLRGPDGAWDALRTETVAGLQGRVQELQADLNTARTQADRDTAELTAANTGLDAALVAAEAANAARRAIESDLASAGDHLERLDERLQLLADELAAARTDLETLPEAQATAAPEAFATAGERVRTARADMAEIATELDRLNLVWKDARRSLEALEEAERVAAAAPAAVEAARAQVSGRSAGLLADRALSQEAAAAAEATRQAAVVVSEQALLARQAAEAARDAARAALLDAERAARAEESGLTDLERAHQQAVLARAHGEEALASLEREREMAVEVLPEANTDVAVSADLLAEAQGLSGEDLDTEFRKVRRTLTQIGSVNPFAVSEHAELSTRLSDMETQQSDLLAAIEATEQLGTRLAEEISERFQAAFTAIGERFEEYCRLLFAGGSASLELSDGGDGEAPGGIEIAVRPPGKRLQRLALLSGGERALTGVALLFAMLSVDPVPFCVLDEVDAALDEANIGRFADALRRLAAEIDFVVITHNRATIETADTIYGVTMTDAAVSRVVSLRLADIPVEVAV